MDPCFSPSAYGPQIKGNGVKDGRIRSNWTTDFEHFNKEAST